MLVYKNRNTEIHYPENEEEVKRFGFGNLSTFSFFGNTLLVINSQSDWGYFLKSEYDIEASKWEYFCHKRNEPENSLKDFEEACKGAKKGDFIFLDSPYAPLNPTSFESYTKEGFDIESHKRLAKLYDELTDRGCYCMLTNHNTDLINELYGNKGYKIDVVSVKRMINSDASNRVGEEVIICNY